MTTYRVSGMTCDGCVRSVTKAVTLALPQAKVKVDLEKGLVTVDGAADAARVAAAVEGAGFVFEGAA